MTLWLKQRLAIWTVAALLGSALVWNVGASRAQSNDSDSTQSAEQVSQAFIGLLTNIGSMHRRYHTDTYFFFDKSATISRKSARDKHAALIFENLASQIYLPQFITRLSASDGKSAKVQVEPDKTAPLHEIILVREANAWKVDLVATYANWNRLTEAQAHERIEKIYEATYGKGNAASISLPIKSAEVPRSQCQSNLKQIAFGIAQYAQDYDEKLPPAKGWVDKVMPYIQNEAIFNCPSLPKNSRYGYAYNSKLSSKGNYQFSQINRIVQLYETSILKRNAYGSGENFAFRHQNGANYVFADGHVLWFPKTQIPSFKLKP